MYGIERTDDEINQVLNQVAEAVDAGAAKYPGMTYEQGVQAGIDWLLGYTDENPLE